MEIILLEKVQNLGDLGNKVTVRPGYGRNYLIPQGIAIPATEENLAKFEARRAELEMASTDVLTAAKARAQAITDTVVTIARKAGEEGKLYGSVGTIDVASALAAAGVDIKKHEVRLPHGPLRQIGDHEIDIHLHTDVNIKAKISIVAE